MGRFWHRLVCGIGAILTSTALATSPVLGQDDYPSKPITIVVPIGVGGPTDSVARILAPELSETLKTTVIVENKPGAENQIGVDYVMRQPADGYTIMLASNSTALVGITNKSFTGNMAKDFVAIAGVGVGPLLLVVSTKTPIKSFADFVAYAKANPGKLLYGSSGAAVTLGIAALDKMAGIKTVTVPFGGAGPVTAALLANDVQATMWFPGVLKPHSDSGMAIGLAVTGQERLPEFPNLPTIAESGYPDFNLISFIGMVARAETPKPVVDKLSRAILAALQKPEIRSKLGSFGFQVSKFTPEEFGRFWNDQIGLWTGIAVESGYRQ